MVIPTHGRICEIQSALPSLRKVCNAHAHVSMETVTKTITLTREAYERLRARKGPNESFSDVILRLTTKRPLAESAGLLSKASVKAIREAIDETRRERRRKVKAQRDWGSEAVFRAGEASFSDDEDEAFAGSRTVAPNTVPQSAPGSDPSRADAFHLREVRVVRDDATFQAESHRGDDAVRHGDIPMGALEKACVSRQFEIERHHLETSMLKGPELGQGIVPPSLLAHRVRHFRNHDGGKNSPTFPAQRGQLSPGPGQNPFIFRCVVCDKEPRIQDFLQSSSSRDSSRSFSIRSVVVVSERKPPRSSRRVTGRMIMKSPRSSIVSRLPSSIW